MKLLKWIKSLFKKRDEIEEPYDDTEAFNELIERQIMSIKSNSIN